jgi:WD40 repeat protein
LEVIPLDAIAADLERDPTANTAIVSSKADQIYLVRGDPPVLDPHTQGDGVSFITQRGRDTWMTKMGSLIRLRDGEVSTRALPGVFPSDVTADPTGRWVAVGALNGTTRVLSAETLEVAAVLRGHSGRVSSVEFSADGEWLYTGSWDGDVRRWGMAALTAEPSSLLDLVTGAWGMDLDGALESSIAP